MGTQVKMDPVAAGALLRALRLEHGYSLDRLAERCGLGVNRIATIERWSLNEPIAEAPDESEVGTLIAALDASPETLVDRARRAGYPAVLLARRRRGDVKLLFLHPPT